MLRGLENRMIGLFIALTMELMLLTGLTFPVLIILLLRDKQIIRVAQK
jgi:hypothetical protein